MKMKIAILKGNITQVPEPFTYNWGEWVRLNIAENYYNWKKEDWTADYKPNYWRITIFGPQSRKVQTAPVWTTVILEDCELRQSVYEKEDWTKIRNYNILARAVTPVQRLNFPAINESQNQNVATPPASNTVPTVPTPSVNQETVNPVTSNQTAAPSIPAPTPTTTTSINEDDLFKGFDEDDLNF